MLLKCIVNEKKVCTVKAAHNDHPRLAAGPETSLFRYSRYKEGQSFKT